MLFYALLVLHNGIGEKVMAQVKAVKYLPVLEGGNFIHLAALVLADNKMSHVETLVHRLRVRI